MKQKNLEDGYLGNKLLKPAGVKFEFTQEQVMEMVKCASDPKYFIKKYVKIVSLDKGVVPFEMWPFQEEIIDLYHDNRYSILKTGRQVGKSTTAAAYMLHYIIFNSDVTVALLANKAETAREILSRVQMAYQYLPKWMQQGIVSWNKGSLLLENGSRVIAASTSSGAIRGYTINLLYLDEFAFVPPNLAEEFFTAVYPTISSGKSSKTIITSTPNGIGNLFYTIWQDAVSGESEFKYLEFDWTCVPTRDEAWKQDQLRNTSPRQFTQEHDAKFLGSSNTLIGGEALEKLRAKKPIYEKEGLRVYEKPDREKIYAMTVDVSEGLGLDRSAFQVIDVTEFPYRQVASYANSGISTLLYPGVIHKVATDFNEAIVLCEINSVGLEVANALAYDYEYENLMYVAQKGRKGQVLANSFHKSCRPGVKTSNATKNIGCNNIKDLIEKWGLILCDADTISEISTFVQKGGSYAAEEGRYDDLMMCLVIFAWMSTQAHFKDMLNKDTRMSLFRDRLENIKEELTPFGFMSSPNNPTVADDEETFWDGHDRWVVTDRPGMSIWN